jgi:hypothetical protein
VLAWSHGSDIQAITRQGAGGTFTNPATLDTVATGGPDVAIDSSGNSIALWPTSATMGAIFAKRHTAGAGPWPSMAEAVEKAGHTFTNPSLAANPVGQLVVAFQDATPMEQPVVSEASGSVSGGFGTSPSIKTLSTTGVSNGPGVAVDNSGAALVAWTASKTVRFSRRPSGGSFPSPAEAQSITPVTGSGPVTAAAR